MLKSKIFLKKTKRGGVIKIVREHYLRDDIFCGYPLCEKCNENSAKNTPMEINFNDDPESNQRNQSQFKYFATLSNTYKVEFNNEKSYVHLLIPDTNVVLHQTDFLEDDRIKNVIILTTVLGEVEHQSLTIYKRLRDLIANPEKHFYVFVNEHHCDTYVERLKGESSNDRNDRAIREASYWYAQHLKPLTDVKVHLLTNDRANKLKAKEAKRTSLQVHTVREYVGSMNFKEDLLEKLANFEPDNELSDKEKFEYPSYVNSVEMKKGIASGKYLQGTFRASRDNYLEGEVTVDGQDQPVFIQGRCNLNRAVYDDTVVIEILPRSKWTCPSSLVLEDTAETADDNNQEDDEKENQESGSSSESNRRPSGKVVGIIKRSWRQYCGILQPSTLLESNKHLFVAADRRIPKIRIETRQAGSLMGKKIIVVIDSWPKTSRYPQGHYVRTLGDIGDKETENEVLLLEHDIPHTAFSQKVLNCLPDANWTCSKDELARRKDLRNLTICSVDPPGCTDIDDALHCKRLPNGNFEVGVHIADVTYFVRPNTAIDEEAANRCTTVYLTDRRIDMVPELLSSNLCSLRSNVDRLAFTVIWEITPDTDTVSVQFMKSIINSKASLTYAAAQDIIDDTTRNDEIAESLRCLNNLAKKLKAKRIEAGALTLASPEIRFEVDSETHDPIQVQEKVLRDTNSMVEEFMLLANVSVAKKIYDEFPQCAVLRRHPLPPYSNFDPILAVCKAYGIEMDVSTNKTLATSLEKAVIPTNPYFNTMLRILATRCMMQAKYFTSGMMQESDFYHYGLAMNIYTHFTSPIRRYADVLVHRLLAVSIGADASYPELLDKQRTQSRDLLEEGYILAIRKNALQVLIPKYGLEGTLYLDNGQLKAKYDEETCTQTVSGHTFHIFDPVKVQVSLDSSNIQHQKLKIGLVYPKVSGLSIDIPSEKNEPTQSNKRTPRKKLKTKI